MIVCIILCRSVPKIIRSFSFNINLPIDTQHFNTKKKIRIIKFKKKSIKNRKFNLFLIFNSEVNKRLIYSPLVSAIGESHKVKTIATIRVVYSNRAKMKMLCLIVCIRK